MKSPLVIAFLHPANLAMLALATAAGLCAAWWLLPVGLILWGMMVLSIARQPALRVGHAMESRTPLAPRFQSKFDRIERVQVNLYNTSMAADTTIQRALQPVLSQIDALIEQVYRLCQRVSALENYRVVSEAKEDLEVEWVKLSEQANRAADPIAQREYAQSVSALEARLAKHRQVAAYLDRVDAQLTGLAGNLEGLQAEILSFQALGAASLREQRSRLVEAVRQEDRQLEAFAREGMQ